MSFQRKQLTLSTWMREFEGLQWTILIILHIFVFYQTNLLIIGLLFIQIYLNFFFFFDPSAYQDELVKLILRVKLSVLIQNFYNLDQTPLINIINIFYNPIFFFQFLKLFYIVEYISLFLVGLIFFFKSISFNNKNYCHFRTGKNYPFISLMMAGWLNI